MSRNISIKEAIGMATKTLVSNKLRSSLTMLGIIIGNASVITLVGLGRGAQTLAKNQLSNLGANVLFIVPGNNDTRLSLIHISEPTRQLLLVSLFPGTMNKTFAPKLLNWFFANV